MPYITVTHQFVDGQPTHGDNMDVNFADCVGGISDGTKDLNINALTCNGNLTVAGNTVLGTSTSNPITVAGPLTITTSIAGQRYLLTYRSHLLIPNATDNYIPISTSSSASVFPGFIMHRAGSIVGWSIFAGLVSFVSTGDTLFRVRKNGSNVLASSTFTPTSSSSFFTYTTTQARNVSTFAAGDAIQLFVDYTSGTYGIGRFLSFVEVYFDT